MYPISLNYFRGLFSSIVCLLHFNQILLYPIYYEQNNSFFLIFDNLGAYSVLGFIFISGYSIGYSLEKNYEKFGFINV